MSTVNHVNFVYETTLYNYWTLNLTSLSLGDQVQSLNQSTRAGAIFDHPSYGLRAPRLSTSAYKELVSATAATSI